MEVVGLCRQDTTSGIFVVKYQSDGFRNPRSRKAAEAWRAERAEMRRRDDAIRRRLIVMNDWLARIERGNHCVMAQMNSADQVIHEWQDGEWVRVYL